MGKLNIPGYSLMVGSMGQVALLSPVFPKHHFIVWMFLLPPWLIVHTITFCRQPPCGVRAFRKTLMFAMGWYATATLLAETLHLTLHLPPSDGWSVTVARCLMCVAAWGFIVYIRLCRRLHRLEGKIRRRHQRLYAGSSVS
jgi:hypothetical protein